MEQEHLQHFGVKGMKWGVRKDRGGSKSERKAQKLQAKMEKKDAKWARKGSRDAFINTWNDANQKINPWIREQNKKPEYKNLDMRKDGPKQRKYIKEYEQKVTSELNKSAQKFATSPSGKKRLEFKFDVDSGPTMKIVDVKDDKNLKQSGDIMSYLSSLLEYEDVEYMDSYPDDIVLQSDSDDGLLHFGVKGMKWGVRKADRQNGSKKAKPTRAEKRAEKKAGPPVDSAKKEMGRMVVHTVGNLAFRLAVKRSLNFQDFSEATRSAANARRDHEIKKFAQKVVTSKVKSDAAQKQAVKSAATKVVTSKVKSDVAQKQAVNAAKSKAATKVVKGAYDVGTMGR